MNDNKSQVEKLLENPSIKKKKTKRFIINLSIGLIIGLASAFIYVSQIRVRAIAYKPVIYLYPTEEMNISVKLGYPKNLTHTYPKYNNGWNVLASPNGNLYEESKDRNYYALYWEGISNSKNNISEGFVVKGIETINFLEEKLAILGLNEKETNEFIIYWLPQLENNKYNFIRFQTTEEQNENMPLIIYPAPETIIRVMMEYKPLNQSIKIQEQTLSSPLRKGYVAVEWGGMKIN